MTAPTNPFAAGLEGHKDEAEQASFNPHSNNPFAPTSNFTTSSSTSSNPFAQPSYNDTATATTASYSIPDEEQQLGTNHFESANEISQQLSGLDFADPPAPSSTNTSAFPDSSNSAPLDSAPSTYQIPETPPAAMTTSFAPPPGPPPGQFDGYSSYAQQQQDRQDASSSSNQQQQTPFALLQQSTQKNEAATTQSDSDEAFARRLLAEDEARARGGRQQSSNGQAAISTPPPRDPNEEKQWNTKEIYWQRRLQRIIIQNENGPCSLIALCNALLLQGILQITPEDRPAVSYSYLASLLGEHLIDIFTTSGSDSAIDLEAALSILPQMQYGLDVNVSFASIFGFNVADGAQGEEKAVPSKELAVFKLCKVRLVHGWLADEDDKDTWGAVVDRSNGYDQALDRIVAGDELAKKSQTESLSPNDALLVKDANLIRTFLESTATQLTYPGLYALSTKLERGTPFALFRNSHISVLYRPTEEELQLAAESLDSAGLAAQPQLYQLVTDSTLENEDGIVWESVEDVDGSASRFYDGKYRQSTPSRDFTGHDDTGHYGQTGEDADFAYAQQLQDQESQRARRQQRQQQGGPRQRNNYNNYAPPPPGGSHSGGGGGGGSNIISRMLAGRKSNKQKTQVSSADARTNVTPQVPNTNGLTLPPTSDSPEPPTNPDVERLMANQRKSDSRRARQENFAEVDRTNFYPVSNDITGLTLPPQSSSNSNSNQEVAPGQEYTAKKEKWFKKIF